MIVELLATAPTLSANVSDWEKLFAKMLNENKTISTNFFMRILALKMTVDFVVTKVVNFFTSLSGFN